MYDFSVAENGRQASFVSWLNPILLPVVVAAIPYQCSTTDAKLKAAQEQAARDQQAALLQAEDRFKADQSQRDQQFQLSLTNLQQSFANAQKDKELKIDLAKLDQEGKISHLNNEVDKQRVESSDRLGQGDINVKMVQLAIDILKSDATQTNQSLRLWATQIVSHHSSVPLPQQATDEAIGSSVTAKASMVYVTVLTQDGKPLSGARAFIARPGQVTGQPFPTLFREDNPSEMSVAPGVYDFWAEESDFKSDRVRAVVPADKELKVEVAVKGVFAAH